MSTIGQNKFVTLNEHILKLCFTRNRHNHDRCRLQGLTPLFVDG